MGEFRKSTWTFVMSKAFGSKVCHVLRVLFYARILFSSSVSHVALYKWVRIRLRQCVRCVFTRSLAPSHVCCCVAVGAPCCSTWLHIALRECFPCAWSVLFQHLGRSRVAVCFPVFNCRISMRDRPLCRNPVERRKFDCERAAFTSVCCGDVHWCTSCFS